MAHNAIALKATVRTRFGKGSARQARRDGLVPVVVYGHGTEPRHLLLDEHTTRLALRGNDNALVELDVDGDKVLALAKDVQRHPIRPGVQHVDFLLVNRNERVEVEVPVVLTGEAAPGALPMIESAHVLVSAPAFEIPETIEVDVTGIAPGTLVTVADLALPVRVEALTDAETGVVNVAEESAVASETAEDESAETSEAAETE